MKDFSRIRRLNKETFLKVYELLSQQHRSNLYGTFA